MSTVLARLLAVTAVITLSLPALAVRGAVPAGALAQVRYIDHGLTIQPPDHSRQNGKLKEPLYDRYGVLTTRSERASIGFRDGTVVHLNHDTSAILSAHLTQVQHGEVAEVLKPGTDHRVQTDAAVASAIGTVYDVRINGNTSVFVVEHGALQVSNRAGSVVVKSGRQTTVIPNHPPSPPTPADTRAVFAWTDGIPTPDLGEDIALDANGGKIVAYSSEREGPGSAGKIAQIDDGLLSQGWQSAAGQTRNQSVTIGFYGGNAYRISDVIIDPAATGGDPASEDLKDFAVRVSSGGTAPGDFVTVYQGTCRQENALQRFTLPTPVRAKYVQLVALSNYGSTNRVAVAEWEVVATASLFAQPQGIAADAAGNIYVADISTNRIDKLSPAGKVIAHWGRKGSEPGQFLRPTAVALDRKGDIYVLDAGNYRVQKLSPGGKPLAQFGRPGLHYGELNEPQGLAVDAQGNMYVTDLYVTTGGGLEGSIQKISPRGLVLDRWTTFGSRLDHIDFPGGISVDPRGHLWTVDTFAGLVVELATSGQALHVYGASVPANDQLSNPTDVVADAAGTAYVVDSFNDRIERITPDGTFTPAGSTGTGPGQFIVPQSIALGPQGTLFVTDFGNNRVARINAQTLKYLSSWGKYAALPQVLGAPWGVAIDPHGYIYVTDTTYDRLQQRDPQGHVTAIFGHHGFVLGQRGPGLGQFWAPHGIAIDRQGEIYVADTDNFRIQELSGKGPIGSLGTKGTDPGNFIDPQGVALDGAGNLYVADTFNERIQRFDPDGHVTLVIKTPAFTSTSHFLPQGIAVDSAGNIYVSSGFDDRILKYSPNGALLATWGNAGDTPVDQFFGPEGLAVDSHDHLWVADTSHGTVEELGPDGRTLVTWNVPGAEPNPTGLAVASNGTVYVADSSDSAIVKFSAAGKVLAIWH